MNRTFDSLWKIGDEVSINFPGAGTISPAFISKVSFDEENNFYDVKIPFTQVEEDGSKTTGVARIHGLKEWHLRNPIEKDLSNALKNIASLFKAKP